MKNYYQEDNRFDQVKNQDVYVPIWAKTLIDLYNSGLRYEVMYETRGNEDN